MAEGWSDRYAKEGSSRKGKKPSGAESRACVRGWVSGERKIKDKREEDCQGVGWVQANDLYGNRGNSMIASR